ncbi:MAG: hypothetical protein HYY65_09600 [Candidatus Tectomicrobia bacterium]|uniref:Uncharacterized protein n=1 Tax=Tectimicrobiota bacterium TaxID=2528274 RepID=A0A932M192_UNCTE|nr:hypothetical protein [Candidatus Tectomicrobia bacterium]
METARYADLYLMSLEHFDQVYCTNKSCAIDAWKMGEKQKRDYDMDKDVQHIYVEFRAHNWAFSDQKAQMARAAGRRTLRSIGPSARDVRRTAADRERLSRKN